MDPVLRAEATRWAWGWGCGGGEGTGSQEDIGGSSPRATLHRPNVTPGKYIFQGQKKACLLWEGVSGCLLGPRWEPV